MRRALIVIVVSVLALAACGDEAPDSSIPSGEPTTTTAASPSVESAATPSNASPWPEPIVDEHQAWTVEIIDTMPHDAEAFTQGLEMDGDQLIEGTGRRDQSTLRRVDLDTGEVLRSIDLDADLFGEGLTIVDDQIIQLTWTSGVAERRDLDTFELIDTHDYPGEGWGLCFDGTDLWMSNGSASITRRDPATFALQATVVVTRDGVPIEELNELECVDGRVIANVFNTNELVVIEPTTGTVTATIDATAIVAATDPATLDDSSADLNGVADLGDGRLLLGGKLWPEFFTVRLVAS